MIAFIIDNLATILISAVLLTVVILISANLIKKKRSGEGVGCSCACNGCASASICHKK